ncbi:MAG: hypothetical protein D6690_15705 [Nitrospirae bacterium]|nr:MAG: hypothetical protein D6690_15705 [Nitrospirota bacterium]
MEKAPQLGIYADNPLFVLQWNGDTCGCVPNTSQIVYGLYPFGLASEKPQYIDLSLSSGIGWVALTIDEKGEIQELPSGEADPVFIFHRSRPYPSNAI